MDKFMHLPIPLQYRKRIQKHLPIPGGASQEGDLQASSDTSARGGAERPRRRGRRATPVPEALRKEYDAYRTSAAGAGNAGADAAEDGRVRAFLAWARGRIAEGAITAAALSEPAAAGRAAAAYRAHLSGEQQLAPATVSRHLSAVSAFYRRRGVEAEEDESAAPARARRGRAPTAVPEAMGAVYADYRAKVLRPDSPLDPDSRRAYDSRVRQYLTWLAAAMDGGQIDGDPLGEQNGANWAARDYRTHLMTVLKRSPETVNAHLTAIGDFDRRRGLAAPDVARQQLPNHAPRALGPRERVRFQRAAERASTRDRALALTGLLAGLRIGEIVALDLDDVQVSARLGELTVRYGKGAKHRVVPMHPKLRAALEAWLQERSALKLSPEMTALFVNRFGTRLSVRAAYDAVVKIARGAGLEIGRGEGRYSPHASRHTTGTILTRDLGYDLVLVAEILGQALNTTRRYTQPTGQDKHNAIAAIPVDE